MKLISCLFVLLSATSRSLYASEHNLTEQLNVKQFGAQGDSKTDDTQAIQKTLDLAFKEGRIVTLPAGGYVISKPLIIPRNVQFIGDGLGFSSSLIPINCDAVWIKGNTQEGGFAFRNKIQNININMKRSTQGKAIVIQNAYNIVLSDMFVFEAPDIGLVIEKSKHISADNLIVYGKESRVGTGVKITDSVVNMYNIDIENINTALDIGPDKEEESHLSVFGGFIERFGKNGISLQKSNHNTFIGLNILANAKEKMPVIIDNDDYLDSKNKTNTFIGGYIGFAKNVDKTKASKAFKLQGAGQTINVGGE